MSDGDALLKAILANPDEDTPRLVYADWLQENGAEERAEFIRVQVEYARLHPHLLEHGSRRCGVCRRGLRLSRLLTSRFLVPLQAPAPFAQDCPHRLLNLAGRTSPRIEWDWYRGFVEVFRCTAADWLKHADAIRAAHPVRKVTLTTFQIPEQDGKAIWFPGRERIDKRQHHVGLYTPPIALHHYWPDIEFQWVDPYANRRYTIDRTGSVNSEATGSMNYNYAAAHVDLDHFANHT